MLKLICNFVKHTGVLPQVTDNCKFDLVYLLEDYENIHIILTDALMEVGTAAIDNNVSVVPAYCVQIQCCGFESCLGSSYIKFLDTNFGAFFS